MNKQKDNTETNTRQAPQAACKITHRIKLPTGVLGCDLTSDGKTLYAACIDGGVYRVDIGSRQHEKIGRHDSYASSVRVLNRSSLVISAGYDGVLRWFDLETHQPVREIKAHDFWSWDMSVSPDERFVASVTGQYTVGGYDYEPAPETEPSVKVFDAQDGTLLHAFPHLPPVQSVAFDPTGRFLAAGNRMGDVHIWDLSTGEQAAAFNTPGFTTWGVRKSHFYAGGVTASQFTPDGKDLLLAGQGEMSKPITSNGRQLWQRFAWSETPARKTDEVHRGESGLGLMETLSVHPSGAFFAMAGRLNNGDWNAALFDLKNGALIDSLSTKNRIVDSAFSADGSTLFLAGMTGQGKDEKLTNDYGCIDVCEVTT